MDNRYELELRLKLDKGDIFPVIVGNARSQRVVVTVSFQAMVQDR